MNIADVAEENVISNREAKEIADSYDRTKDEKGENVDAFFKTIYAINEANDICNNPKLYKQYASAEDIMNEVLDEV